MTLYDASLLGLVQGLTEFLPVSSSGHLVLLGHVLGIEAAAQNVLFDVILHMATLAAVLVVYGRDALSAARAFLLAVMAFGRQGWGGFGVGVDPADLNQTQRDAGLGLFILVASVPTGIIGIAFKDSLEALFASPRAAAAALLVTAVILLTTWPAARRKETGRSPGVVDALLMGLLQGLAIVPGISRSGSTIAGALWRGIDGEHAARASFLMSLPAITGALLLELRHFNSGQIDMMAVGAGALVAFVSGIVAISLVRRVLRFNGFWVFAPYCLLLGTLGLWFIDGSS